MDNFSGSIPKYFKSLIRYLEKFWVISKTAIRLKLCSSPEISLPQNSLNQREEVTVGSCFPKTLPIWKSFRCLSFIFYCYFKNHFPAMHGTANKSCSLLSSHVAFLTTTHSLLQHHHQWYVSSYQHSASSFAHLFNFFAVLTELAAKPLHVQ